MSRSVMSEEGWAPGPDGPCNRTDAAGLEVPDRSLSERARSRIGNGSLDRPAEPRHHSHDLACDGSEAQAGAQDAEKLDGALTVDVGPVGPRNSEHHAHLVQCQRRQIRAGDEDDGSQDPVLLREALDDLFADGFPNPRQLRGERIALVSGPRRDPLDDLLDGQWLPHPDGHHVRSEHVRQVGDVFGSAPDQDDERWNPLPRREPKNLLVVTTRSLALDRVDEERGFVQVGGARGAPAKLAERRFVATLTENFSQLSDVALRAGQQDRPDILGGGFDLADDPQDRQRLNGQRSHLRWLDGHGRAGGNGADQTPSRACGNCRSTI